MKRKPMPDIVLTPPDSTDLRDSLAWLRHPDPRDHCALEVLLRPSRRAGFDILAP
jgi:hypothetical protein